MHLAFVFKMQEKKSAAWKFRAECPVEGNKFPSKKKEKENA
jgi:hypothetical protein